MKKRIAVFMLMVLCVMQFAVPFAHAETQVMTYDFLQDQGYARGDSKPSKEGSLPYTASWNSVKNYTNTNKYFSGYGAIKVTLDTQMNYSGEKGRFRVYLVDMTDGSTTCIIDSDSAMFSYKKTRYYFPDSGHSFYLKFTISGNSTSCFGSMRISVP